MADKSKESKGGAKSMVWGVKNPSKCGNKYDGFGVKKGKKGKK